jgi:soluble lytic murein transglycosylase
MRTLIRYTYHVTALALLLSLTFVSVHTKVSKLSMTAKDLPRIQTEGQVEHAMELFRRAGFSYLLTDEQPDLRPFILETVETSLPAEFQAHAFEIARSVIVEANHLGLDPLFLLAVIKTESKFNLKARGSHGEIGLMQILPTTAAWIAPQAGMPANFNLEDPAVNIRIGATYFAQLRRDFDGKTHRYVGAYNMGAGNVRRLVASNIEPKEYPSRVLGNYNGFYKNLSRVVISRLTHQKGRRLASIAQDAPIVSFSIDAE